MTEDSTHLANQAFHVKTEIDDDGTRDMVNNAGAHALDGLTPAQRVSMIKAMMEGWISDADVSSIVKLLGAVQAPADMATIRTTIKPLANDMWSTSQKTKIINALTRI